MLTAPPGCTICAKGGTPVAVEVVAVEVVVGVPKPKFKATCADVDPVTFGDVMSSMRTPERTPPT